MTQCNLNKDPYTMVVLIYVAIGFGAVSNFTVFVYYCWVSNRESKASKQNNAGFFEKLCSVIILMCWVERVIRIWEVWLWYHGGYILRQCVYTVNNCLCCAAIVIGICLLLSQKLISTFHGTYLELSVQQKYVVFFLMGIVILFTYSFLIMNGIPSIYDSSMGKLIMIIGSGLFVICSLFFFIKVNIEFVNRLSKLIASSAVIKREESLCVSMAMMDPSNDDSFAKYAPPSGIAQNESDDFQSNLTCSELSSLKQIEMEHSHKFSLSAYDEKDRRILKAATRFTTLSLLISLGFSVLACSALLFAISECGTWITVLGHCEVCGSYLIISISTLLALNKCSEEYDYLCIRCDHLVRSFVTSKTNKRALKIQKENLESKKHSSYHAI